MINYFGAMIGAVIGMTFALLVFRNVWRIGYLPAGYDFIHDIGKAQTLKRFDSPLLSYATRYAMAIFLLPVIFLYIWGKDGILGISILDSTILTAVVLMIIESSVFALALKTRVMGVPPRDLVNKLIVLQFVNHIILGISMGYFADSLVLI